MGIALPDFFDQRRFTAFWPLISTIEGELKDTPWWKFRRRMALRRELDNARHHAFASGIELAMKDLVDAGMAKPL